MFDITSSKLLLLGIVALLVIGPKDFPALLRTIGKYVGIIRGHAREFRAQFDEAMRESELADLKKDVENIARETEASMQATGRSVEDSLAEARQGIDSSLDTSASPPPDPLTHNADGLAIAPPQPAGSPETALNGSSHAGEARPDAPAGASEPGSDTRAQESRPAEKSGM
jgi:sec-independent protein translocase protein TatB